MSITVPIPEQLTAAQADGRACVACGSEEAAMRPVGDRAGVQLFACVACIDRANAPKSAGEPLWGHAADHVRDRLSAYCPPVDVARTVARRFLDEAHAIDVDTAHAAKMYASWGAVTAVLSQLLDALDAEERQ